jgi:hypothetical protein
MRLHVARRRMGMIILVSLCGLVFWCKLLVNWPSAPSMLLLSPPSLSDRGEVHRRSTRRWTALGISTSTTKPLIGAEGSSITCQHTTVPRNPPPRIKMTLLRGHSTQNVYNKAFNCGPSSSSPVALNKTTTRHVHPSMNSARGVLDFTTLLSTDLKILVMGDSVAMQISQTLEEMLGGTNPENHRKVYRYTLGEREGLHVSAPIRGGGVIAGWRLLGMLLKENLNAKMPIEGPGWKMEDVHKILQHTYNTTSIKSMGDFNYTYTNGGQQQQRRVETATQVMIGSFDVLLFHIPIGWIRDYNSINNITLMETVLLAGELFGVETVVFNVPSFTNNILTAQHLQSLRAAQNRVVQFAKDFEQNQAMNTTTATTTTTVRRVLTLRMDRLMDQTMEWNARLMGMIPSETTAMVETTATTLAAATSAISATSEDDEIDWRLVAVETLNPNRKFIHHVAQTCSALPSTKTPKMRKTCTPNYFSRDGMHICMETMGGRIFAGLGCVLGCVYNTNDEDENDVALLRDECRQQSSSTATRTALDHENDVMNCANSCNDRYLSLTSVDNEVLDSLKQL